MEMPQFTGEGVQQFSQLQNRLGAELTYGIDHKFEGAVTFTSMKIEVINARQLDMDNEGAIRQLNQRIEQLVRQECTNLDAFDAITIHYLFRGEHPLAGKDREQHFSISLKENG